MDLLGLEPRTCRLRVEVTLFFTSPYQCGRWGSNPRHLGGGQGCSRYTTSTKRNSQESNLLPPGLQPGAHPHELEFHDVRTGGVEPPPRGPEPRVLPLHHVQETRRRTTPRLLHGTTVQLSRSSSRTPLSGHAAARWEGLEPSSPGLEPGVLAVERPPLTSAQHLRRSEELPESK